MQSVITIRFLITLLLVNPTKPRAMVEASLLIHHQCTVVFLCLNEEKGKINIEGIILKIKEKDKELGKSLFYCFSEA